MDLIAPFVPILFLMIIYVPMIGALQFFLSYRENKWPGKILTIVSAIAAFVIIMVIYIVPFFIYMEFEFEFEFTIIIGTLIFVLPSIIFYLIYRIAQRSYINKNKAKDIDRMKIMDL